MHLKKAVFWDVATYRVIITLMMEAVSFYETSVNIYETKRCDIPEDSRLHTRRRENLKPHIQVICICFIYSENSYRVLKVVG
jgi:hypothetical protein